MPRALDRRQLEADYDPTRSGTEFHFGKMLGTELEVLRQALEAAADNLKILVVEFIRDTLGIDLTSWEMFLTGFGDQLGLDDVGGWVQSVIGAFDGIDLDAGPGAIMDAIATAVADIPGVGPLIAAILGGPGDETDVADFFTGKWLQIGNLDDWTAELQDQLEGFGTDPGAVLDFITNADDAVADALQGLKDRLTDVVDATDTDIDNWLLDLLTGSSDLDAANLTNLANIGTIAKAKISGLQDDLDDLLSDLAGKLGIGDDLDAANLTNLANIGAIAQSKIAGLPAALAALASLTDFQTLLNNIFDGASGSTGSTGKTLANVLAALQGQRSTVTAASNDAADALSDAATAIAGLADKVGSTVFGGFIDAVKQGADGSATTGNSVSDAKDALLALLGIGTDAAESAANAATIAAALMAEQTAGSNGGTSASVNFGEYANGAVPSVFTQVLTDGGPGSVGVSGGKIVWTDAGNADSIRGFLYNEKPLLTDYFEVSMVMPNLSQAHGFDVPAYNYLIGRSNSAGTVFVDARISRDGIRIGYVGGGVQSWLAAEEAYAIPAGSLITFRGGTAGGVRVFQVLAGGQVRASATDGSLATTVNVANRYCGWAIQARGAAFGGQITPGTMSVFTMNDNTPPTVVGQGLQVYRSSTAAVNIPTGDQQLPGGFFDQTEASTPNITWNAATSTATVLVSDWYTIDFNARCTTTMGSTTGDGEVIDCLIYVNGGIKRRATSLAITALESSSDSLSQDFNIGITKSLYLAANSTIRPGIYCLDRALSITGNANGDFANLTIVKGKQ